MRPGTDVDGDALTYAVAGGPAHGAVTLTGASALFTPAANAYGADAFTFTVSDGAATSAPALVSLVVTAVPDAPVALAQSPAGLEDAPLAITLAATNVGGGALTYAVTTTPAHGTLTGNPSTLGCP